MTNDQLVVALQELRGDVAVMAERIDQMSQRLYDLEQRVPDPLWAEKAEAEDLRRMDDEFAGRRRGLVSMDVPPPVGNDGSGPPPDYDG